MASTVVDELVVELRLDASEYEKADKKVDAAVTKTQKKQDSAAKKDKDRARDEKARMQERQKQIKAMTGTVKEFAGAALAVVGVTATIGGFVGMLAGLASTESAMKRATVATGMSVREMNAWRTAAQRLTGDAEGGANAIAALAREQTTGRFTGNMQNIAALMAAGVNVTPGMSTRDILVSAQKRYQAVPENQRALLEGQLGAAGLDPSLINMIRSKQDVGAVYDKSLAESAQMDEKGVDAFNDALATMQNELRDLATVVMQTVTPALKDFGEWATGAIKDLAHFSDQLKQAGGGVDGFIAVVTSKSPALGEALQFITDMFSVGAGVMKVVINVLGNVLTWANEKLTWLLNKAGVSTGKGGALGDLKDLLLNGYHALAEDAREGDVFSGHHTGAVMNQTNANAVTGPRGAGIGGKAGDFVNKAIAAGFSPGEAVALAAQARGESNFDTNAFNPRGGGQGAQGLFQWRGARLDAYRKRYGHGPREGTVEEALDFIKNDPYESRLLRKSLAAGGSPADMAARLNDIFEGNGIAAQASWRAGYAQQIYAMLNQGDTGGPRTTGDGNVIVTGDVTVVANDPKQFGQQVKKVTGAASANNTATR